MVSFGSAELRLHAADDPALVAYRLTGGSFDFGATRGEVANSGFLTLLVGIIFCCLIYGSVAGGAYYLYTRRKGMGGPSVGVMRVPRLGGGGGGGGGGGSGRGTRAKPVGGVSSGDHSAPTSSNRGMGCVSPMLRLIVGVMYVFSGKSIRLVIAPVARAITFTHARVVGGGGGGAGPCAAPARLGLWRRVGRGAPAWGRHG